MNPNIFQMLQLSPDSTFSEVKQCYKKAVKTDGLYTKRQLKESYRQYLLDYHSDIQKLRYTKYWKIFRTLYGLFFAAFSLYFMIRVCITATTLTQNQILILFAAQAAYSTYLFFSAWAIPVLVNIRPLRIIIKFPYHGWLFYIFAIICLSIYTGGAIALYQFISRLRKKSK